MVWKTEFLLRCLDVYKRQVLAIPNFPVSTKKARAIMPKQVALEDAVYNMSHAAYLALALVQGDILSLIHI